MSDFQKGIVYASWLPGEYASEESDDTLAQAIRPLGVNWISIVVTCYQDTISSTRIECKPESLTPTDADLAHIIEDAHRAGLRVMLKPHVDLADPSYHWRGEIDPGPDEAAWQKWFRSYADFITHYAQVASDNNADYLVVGTELTKTSHRTDDWRRIVEAVRTIYSGPLTYAAHHHDEESSINWWDALDAIGVDAYYPLARNNHPKIVQIKTAWAPIVSKLGRLSKKWNRPVILTEVGYESLEGANRSPWQTRGHTIEFEEQANCYQAAFEAFSGQPWWHGIFWWVWTVHTARDSALNEAFTTYNKPADDILMGNYGKTTHTIPPPLSVQAQTGQLHIFHDTLGSGWQDRSHLAVLSIDISKTGQLENTELKVSIQPSGSVSFHHTGIDTSPYIWLEFYLYAGRHIDQHLLISFSDSKGRELPQKIQLPDPRYVEGGRFLTSQWQRIRIPIADMGALNSTITRLNLKNNTAEQPVEFFIDEISLTGIAKEIKN